MSEQASKARKKEISRQERLLILIYFCGFGMEEKSLISGIAEIAFRRYVAKSFL